MGADLRLEIEKSPSLAHTSCYLRDDGEAFVIEPMQEINAYIKLVREDRQDSLCPRDQERRLHHGKHRIEGPAPISATTVISIDSLKVKSIGGDQPVGLKSGRSQQPDDG